MKKKNTIFVAMLLALGMLSPGHAQSLIDGQVTKIDAPAGKITIRHGPIKKFDMEDGHTMVFRAQDTSMLGAVKAGDKIKFDAEKVNGQFTVTRIEKTK